MNQSTPILFFALALSACAPAEPVVGDSVDTQSAEILVVGVEQALEEGYFTIENQNSQERTADGDFLFEDDAWMGSIEGSITYVWTDSKVDWEIDAALWGFGVQQEDFTGDLIITMEEQFSTDDLILTFEGTVDSTVSGPIDVDIEIVVQRHQGLKGVVFSGTVNERWVQGQYEQKEEIEDYGDDCKAPIGVDCD